MRSRPSSCKGPVVVFAVLALGLAAACHESEAPDSPQSFELVFESISVDPGKEKYLCQSIVLNNSEPVYVNTVAASSGAGWHHSNWYFVPEDSFPGPEGSWPCIERNFTNVDAGIVGGPLFAQSTQAAGEVQAFAPGAAVLIPPHSQIIGDVHLFNTSDAPLQTNMTLEVTPIAETETRAVLRPFVLTHASFSLAPKQVTEIRATCDIAKPHGETFDYSFYYALPHYHSYGVGLTASIVGGDLDGTAVVSSAEQIGEPQGVSMTPAMLATGMTAMTFGCIFDNPTDKTVHYGFGADDEMCAIFAFTDSPFRVAGSVEQGPGTMSLEGNKVVYETTCDLVVVL